MSADFKEQFLPPLLPDKREHHEVTSAHVLLVTISNSFFPFPFQFPSQIPFQLAHFHLQRSLISSVKSAAVLGMNLL